ncbi:hypothetical protein VZT92_005786 [Zoarces viviparus]|uniref:Uncharacterized protein n=1 Tax=Zoarces viviparus TaxID=48416 RepID=A0AAW1FME2_ZOAVI
MVSATLAGLPESTWAIERPTGAGWVDMVSAYSPPLIPDTNAVATVEHTARSTPSCLSADWHGGDRGLCTSSRALDITLSSLARFLRPPALLLSTFLLLCAEGPAAVLPPVGFQFEGAPFSSTNKWRGFIVRGDFSGALSPGVLHWHLGLSCDQASSTQMTPVTPDVARLYWLQRAARRTKPRPAFGPERGPDGPTRNCLVGPILVLPILWVITCRIPLVRTSSKSAARRQPRRPARSPREWDPTGTVAEEIREKGPARVQSRRHRPPDPIPSTGPPSTRP